tara:strand:- start:224 stop:745 length:522 start_codon:yes stop_codon:yes gene_type:complete
MNKKFLYFVIFVGGLLLFRLVPHPPNFTPILSSALVAPFLFRNKLIGILITLLAMFISDFFLGFHPYQIVIYLCLISISLFSPSKNTFVNFGIGSILASSWFFLVTNFAVWLAWDYYPKTLEGIIQCYLLAIPFFTNTLLSTVFFTGILILFLKPVENDDKKNSFNYSFNKNS